MSSSSALSRKNGQCCHERERLRRLLLLLGGLGRGGIAAGLGGGGGVALALLGGGLLGLGGLGGLAVDGVLLLRGLGRSDLLGLLLGGGLEWAKMTI